MAALVHAHASELIAVAQSKSRQLTAKERRHCLQYLQSTDAGRTNQELGDLFNVTERQIRVDKANIREERARFLRDEISKDLSTVISDITFDFERQVADLERSKSKCKLGTKPYVDHCNSIWKLRVDMIKSLQDIGYLPKNIGAMTVEKFEYKATVSQDGAINTRSVDMFDDKPVDSREDEAKKREALDAEFTDVPQLPETVNPKGE
jgi:DNA-binding CsgD family transcriptional regulator